MSDAGALTAQPFAGPQARRGLEQDAQLVAVLAEEQSLDAPAGLPSASLAAGKRARASNVYRKSRHYGAHMVLDDDHATRWATDTGTKQAWLEVDLGKAAKFDRVKIAEAYDRVRKFELQYKNNSQWKTFARGTKIGDAYSKTFEPVTARQVRLNILESADGPTIWEFQLMAPKKGCK